MLATANDAAGRSLLRDSPVVVDHLGAERATFDRSFDLPLLALADDPDLQDELLGHALPSEDDGNATRADEGWRTLEDGRRIKLYG